MLGTYYKKHCGEVLDFQLKLHFSQTFLSDKTNTSHGPSWSCVIFDPFHRNMWKCKVLLKFKLSICPEKY